ADTVVALVGDLLSAPREYAPLLDLALGGTAQCFVVRDLDRVTEALADLPAVISGRVSFLPLRPDAASSAHFVVAGFSPRLRGLKPAAPDSSAELDVLPDGVLRASHLVLCEGPDLAGLPEQVLGDTLIVADLATARALAAEYPGYRFVTRQGELLDADGVLTVGTYH